MGLRCFTVAAFGLLLAAFGRAEEANFQWTAPRTNAMHNLAEVLEPLRARLKFPALSAAVVCGNRVTASGATGFRQWGITNDPVTPGDAFHIGSCTKSFTALLALLNARQLPLETRVSEVFPEWHLPEGAEKITLRLLLQNRSGLGNKPSPELWSEAFAATGSGPAQRLRFLEQFLRESLDAEPGTAFIYSNIGYALAGAMLETRLKTPWEALIREHVFKPLKLESAGFGALGAKQPQGHQFGESGPILMPEGDNPVAIAPAGAIHMSVLDLATYAAFHLGIARGEVAGLRKFRPDLYTPPSGSEYALGWVITERDWAGGKALTHEGSNTMYHTVIWIAPERDFAIVVCTNIGDRSGSRVSEGCDLVVGELIKLTLGELLHGKN